MRKTKVFCATSFWLEFIIWCHEIMEIHSHSTLETVEALQHQSPQIILLWKQKSKRGLYSASKSFVGFNWMKFILSGRDSHRNSCMKLFYRWIRQSAFLATLYFLADFFLIFFPLKDSNWPELSFPRGKVLIYWFSDTSLKVVPLWTRSWSLIEMKLRLIALNFNYIPKHLLIFIVLDCIGRFCSMGHAHCTLQKVIKLHYLIAQKNNFLMKTIVCGSRRPGVLWCYEWQLDDCQWQNN